MASIAGILERLAPSIESEVRSRLQGFLGGILRGYLPQTWVFRTEQETASLVVERDGKVAVVPAAAPSPDVTIEIGHDRLAAALTTRSREGLPPGPMTVTPHTAKGRTAFDYLRGRLGL
jgi:hypothetical protein